MTHDVVIAGAGPVGLFLACELRLAGCSVLVLEATAEPDAPLKRAPFGLRGLNAPSLEALHRRGLLGAVAAPSRAQATDGGRIAATAHWMQQARRPGGHFAGIPFFEDQIDAAAWPWRLPDAAGASLAVELQTLEAVLAERAAALGAEIRRGVAVEGVDPAEEAVTVRAGGERFRGRWLVGCDGGRSTVRKAAGFAFEGTAPEFTGYSLEVELADPDALPAGRHYTARGMFTYARPGVIALVHFDGGAFHRTDPVTLDHAQTVLREVTGVDLAVTALIQAATWTDRACQAAQYRRGPVLLAGDAAHVHSPLGGQGLNLGLGDAMNLGWKLAATVRGDAPAGLLDSYGAERAPVGAAVLDWSRAQVALMRPSPASRALEAVIRDLVATRDGATYFAGRVWGVGLRHDLGEAHPLVGRSAPDFAFADGTRLSERLRTARGLLLDFGGDAGLRAVAERWRGVDYLAMPAEDTLGLSALLVRPDGVVAWAAEGTADAGEAADAASRWFVAER